MKYILEKTGLTYLMLKIKEFFIKKPVGGTLGLVLMMGSSEPEWSNLPTMLTYKGQLSTESDLANVQNPSIGDVYFIVDSSKEFVCIDNTTSPVTWEALGIDLVLVDWNLIDLNAKDYIKNKPTEPGSNGYFVRYNNNNQYSWTEGLSLLQFNELERYPVHNYLPHNIHELTPGADGSIIKIIEIKKDNIDGNTVFAFDLCILSNNYSDNYGNNYYYYINNTVLVLLIGNQWTVLSACHGRVNFGSSAIRENSLRAYVDLINNNLVICWQSGVKAGGFHYYVRSDIRTDGTYNVDLIRQENLIYYTEGEPSRNSDCILRSPLLFNSLVISNIDTNNIVSFSNIKKIDTISYQAPNLIVAPNYADMLSAEIADTYTLTIKGSNSSLGGGVLKKIIIYNNTLNSQDLIILPDTGFTLYNMYDSSGTACTITIPSLKCLELTVTYWGLSKATWNGRLEQ